MHSESETKGIANNERAIHIILRFVIVCILVLGVVVGVKQVMNDTVETAGGVIASKKTPIYCVKSDSPKIALTFDAAWGNSDTSKILKILADNDVKATFFMTGGWMENYPDDVKAIRDGGHDLGNHSQRHKEMSKLSKEDCVNELMKPHKYIKELTGEEMCLFRPPYGDYNDNLIETAKECGYYVIQWSVDSLDWKDYGKDSIIKTVTQHKNLKNGAIILMHNGAKYTADALDSVIKILKEKGYEFVPVSELILRENYEIDFSGQQYAK